MNASLHKACLHYITFQMECSQYSVLLRSLCYIEHLILGLRRLNWILRINIIIWHTVDMYVYRIIAIYNV